MPSQSYRSLLGAGLVLCAATLSAQNAPATAAPTAQAAPAPAADNTADLAKATQNPVANLISVPFQNNTNFGIGPYNRTQDVLNVQPVIPARISEKWMVISRIIQPIVWQPAPTANAGGQYGFGDMNPTFFLSPAKPGKLIWGFGPAIVIPTATSTALGQGKLSFGPSAVALAQPGHWTLGALVNNVFSVAGSPHRPYVNQMLLQYFINYNLKKGWFLTWQPTLTANWKAADGNRWVVPLGGGIGRIMRLGAQPVNIGLQFYGNAVHPPGGSPWAMRIQFAFLFPKMPKKK
jgi:hypothetical protein